MIFYVDSSSSSIRCECPFSPAPANQDCPFVVELIKNIPLLPETSIVECFLVEEAHPDKADSCHFIHQLTVYSTLDAWDLDAWDLDDGDLDDEDLDDEEDGQLEGGEPDLVVAGKELFNPIKETSI